MDFSYRMLVCVLIIFMNTFLKKPNGCWK